MMLGAETAGDATSPMSQPVSTVSRYGRRTIQPRNQPGTSGSLLGVAMREAGNTLTTISIAGRTATWPSTDAGAPGGGGHLQDEGSGQTQVGL